MSDIKNKNKVRTRELVIGEPWAVLVRVRNLDVTAYSWSSQLRPFNESEEILATPTVTSEIDIDNPDDTLIHIDLSGNDSEDFEPGRCVWGLKATTTLFWGDLLLVDRPVRS